MNPLLQWLLNNVALRRASRWLGGVATGLWIGQTYWREIKATREVWGVDATEWANALLAVIGASLTVGASGLAAAKRRRERKASELREAP